MHSIDWQLKYSNQTKVAFALLSALVLLAGITLPALAQTETLLHQFTGSPDGANPYAGPVLKGTTLYGTAVKGGTLGTMASYTRSARRPAKRRSCTPSPASERRRGPSIRRSSSYGGNLFGMTLNGGEYNYGTIYELTKSGKNMSKPFSIASTSPDGANPTMSHLFWTNPAISTAQPPMAASMATASCLSCRRRHFDHPPQLQLQPAATVTIQTLASFWTRRATSMAPPQSAAVTDMASC